MVSFHHMLASFFASFRDLGGPGGSGVQYIMQFGSYFRDIIGPAYDLVGFDPRGKSNPPPPSISLKTTLY